MKREELVRIGVECCILNEYDDGEVLVCPANVGEWLECMRAVEQATLERAEKVCEDYANFAATTMDALFAANYIASKIYKLKD